MDKNNIPLMASIPVRRFDWKEDKDTGKITILRPKFVSRLGQKYMLPFFMGKHFKIKLDELGTAVWKNCDGRKTVADIKHTLESTFEDMEDVDKRLKKFIMQLYREKFITLVQKRRLSE